MWELKRRIIAALFIASMVFSAPAWSQDAEDLPGALSLLMPAADGNGEPKRSTLYSHSYALVIGIDKFSTGWPALHHAVEEAAEVAAALKKQGFEITPLNNPTRAELVRAMDEFFYRKDMDRDARLLLWFGGHGWTLQADANQEMEGYLVANDTARPETEEEFLKTAIPFSRVHDYMRRSKARHILSVFDSCFSGTIFEQKRSTNTLPDRIAARMKNRARYVITSGSKGQEVPDKSRFQKLFVRALAGDVNAEALLQGSYLTAKSLGDFLKTEISIASQEKQVPQAAPIIIPPTEQGEFIFKIGNGKILDAMPRPRLTRPERTASSDPRPSLPPVPASPLDALLDKCVLNERHLDAEAMARGLRDYVRDRFAHKQRFENVPRFTDNKEKERGGVVRLPKDISSAEAAGPILRLFFSSSDAEVALVPVKVKGGDVFAQSGILLQGVWKNERGNGCLEAEFDREKGAGQVKWWVSDRGSFVKRYFQKALFFSDIRVIAMPAQ